MKKFLSIILALTMVIALVPAVFAADTDALVYKFCRESYGSTDISDARDVASYDKITAIDTEPFRMVATTAMSRKAFWEGEFNYSVYHPATNDSILGFGLIVDKNGAMEASVTYQQKDNSYTADVYLVRNTEIQNVTAIDMTINTALSTSPNFDSNTTNATYWRNLLKGENVQYLGSVNMQDGEASKVCTVSLANAAMVTSGEYYLIFTYNSSTYTNDICYTSLRSFTLTPLTEDTALTNAFIKDENKEDVTNSYTAPTVTGLTSDTTITAKNGTISGTFTLTAPATKADKGSFLYWAKGMTKDKKIVSFSNVLENYMPEENGRNYLVAVYEGDLTSSTDKEYFNQNGQRVATRTAEDTTIPDLPSMAGYGVAKEWKQHGKTNIWVADYEKTKDDRDEITVDVVNGTGGGTVLFGDTVTCTANGTGTFKCWTKSNIYGATEPEIVSVDKTYTFKAWEDCTVKAEYEAHNYTGAKMKIIIDTFDAATGVTGVMAEFIGLDSAVEKGIMFTDSEANTTKIAMTTKDNQFTVIADESGTYEGYAIVGNATDGYTLITDGSYTK
ncbi:MAG: hypothetical protein IJF32_12385 [Oscillospiraceae bacterium]|nr:hypothetical protein [Oscillospiraceae bacterium]